MPPRGRRSDCSPWDPHAHRARLAIGPRVVGDRRQLEPSPPRWRIRAEPGGRGDRATMTCPPGSPARGRRTTPSRSSASQRASAPPSRRARDRRPARHPGRPARDSTRAARARSQRSPVSIRSPDVARSASAPSGDPARPRRRRASSAPVARSRRQSARRRRRGRSPGPPGDRTKRGLAARVSMAPPLASSTVSRTEPSHG